MARYCSNSEEVKKLRRFLSKFGQIEINNELIKGSIIILGYRKYSSFYEVDIEFKGEIFARPPLGRGREWLNSEVLKKPRCSKVKVNRFIRKNLFKELSSRLRFFSITLYDYSDIKKLKWI
jgi:hypothetical protein